MQKKVKTASPDLPQRAVQITPPNLQTVEFLIIGTAPYVQQAFSQKAKQAIRDGQLAGSQSKKGKKREPKDFLAAYEGSKHLSTEGWSGIPASAFRAAMISACRLVNFKMTLAKMSIFVEADGFEADGNPLVKIQGEPHYCEHSVRIKDTVDLRARVLFHVGWRALVRIKFDLDQFSLTDVANLLARVGVQVGIGEGRPDSRSSAGMGWGNFRIANEDETA